MDPRGGREWRRSRVFVTGATGLLGSAIVPELLDRGANVTILLRDWVPASHLIASGLAARANVVAGDLTDLSLLSRALNEYEIDTVFHLGAQTIVGTAARGPVGTFEANVRGTWNLLEACRLNDRLVQRVVVASSDKAYGSHERLPYTEDAPLQGRFPYDASKSCADLIALSYFHTYRSPVAITRCGNLWGPGDLNFSRLVPGTIKSALLDERPVIRSDGTFRRDYFHVRDAAAAYRLLAEKMGSADVAGEAFYFGNERPLTVLEVVQRILGYMRKSHLEPIVLNQASAEIPEQYLDCSKARRVLAWEPHGTFEERLEETIAWYRQHLPLDPSIAR